MAIRTYHVGALGRAHRLTNLTGSWVDVSLYITYPGFNKNLYDVKTDPNDSDKVFVVGEADNISGFTGIAVSSNAGATWVAPGGNYSSIKQWNEVWTIDSSNIVAVGATGACAISNDGGLTFNLTTYATPSGTSTVGQSLAVHFITSLIGVASFGGFILKTINGGGLWTVLNGGSALNIMGGSVTVTAVYMSSNQTTIVVNTNRAIFTSTNSGATFTLIHSWTQREGLHMCWLPRYNATKFWATGQGDARVSSVAPASSWTVLSPTILSLAPKDFAAHFYTFNDGFFSRDAELRKSIDSGITGTVSDTLPSGVIFAVWTTATPCYRLVDCLGIQTTIITSTDLSGNVGQFVSIDGYEGCWIIGNSDLCTGAIPVTVTDGVFYDSCEECLPACYILTDCKGEKDPIYTSTDLTAYVGMIVQIQGDDTCWTITQSVNCDCMQDVIVMRQYTVCSKCPPPVIPHVSEPFIEPGYNTPNCDPEEVIQANIDFADAIYKKVAKKRFGINICCEFDEEEIILRKETTDLSLLYNPKLCPVVPEPCLPPCNVTAYISLFTGGGCPAPSNITATITV